MKKVICLMLCTVVPALAQEKKEAGAMTDPVEILKKADDAAKAVKTVKYDATFEGISESAAQFPKVEGKAIMDGELNNAPKRWLYEVKVTMPNSAEVKSYTAGSDGENYFLFDMAGKKAYRDIDPAALGSNRRVIQAIQMTEYVHSKPFSDEIDAEKKELKGTLGDFIRLLQLEKELEDEQPKEIEVRWVEPSEPGNANGK